MGGFLIYFVPYRAVRFSVDVRVQEWKVIFFQSEGLITYRTPKKHMVDSAECWPNIKSVSLPRL
jgi:hypothetical protein